MSYKVLDNNKPAILNFITYKDWSCFEYKTFDEALNYAKLWLGDLSETIPNNWDGSPYDYNGYGDTISIIKEE